MSTQANHRRGTIIASMRSKAFNVHGGRRHQPRKADPSWRRRIVGAPARSTSSASSDSDEEMLRFRETSSLSRHQSCGPLCKTTMPTLQSLLQNTSNQSGATVVDDQDEGESYKECLVCWDCIDDSDDHGPHDCLPCGHVFHRACINDWRYCNQSCPTCRMDLEFAEMHC